MTQYLRTFLIISMVTLGGCANIDFGDRRINDEIYGSNVSEYEKGKIEFAAERFGLALKHFRKALFQAPGNLEVLNGLAASYDKLRRFDISKRYYEMALKIDPQSPETLNNFGYSYYMQRKHDVAKVLLREAAARSKDQWVGHANLRLVNKATTPAVKLRGKLDANKNSGPVKENNYSTIFSAPEIPLSKRLTSNGREKSGASGFKQNSGRKMQLIRTAAATHTIFTRGRPGASQIPEPEIAVSGSQTSETKLQTTSQFDRLLANAGNEKPANVPSNNKSKLSSPVQSGKPVKANEPVQAKLATKGQENMGPSSVSLVIANGTGRSKMASRMRSHLNENGYERMWLSNAANYRKRITTLFYKVGWKDLAENLAKHLPGATRLVERTDQRTSLYLELGADLLDFDKQLIHQLKRVQNYA